MQILSTPLRYSIVPYILQLPHESLPQPVPSTLDFCSGPLSFPAWLPVPRHWTNILSSSASPRGSSPWPPKMELTIQNVLFPRSLRHIQGTVPQASHGERQKNPSNSAERTCVREPGRGAGGRGGAQWSRQPPRLRFSRHPVKAAGPARALHGAEKVGCSDRGSGVLDFPCPI